MTVYWLITYCNFPMWYISLVSPIFLLLRDNQRLFNSCYFGWGVLPSKTQYYPCFFLSFFLPKKKGQRLRQQFAQLIKDIIFLCWAVFLGREKSFKILWHDLNFCCFSLLFKNIFFLVRERLHHQKTTTIYNWFLFHFLFHKKLVVFTAIHTVWTHYYPIYTHFLDESH